MVLEEYLQENILYKRQQRVVKSKTSAKPVQKKTTAKQQQKKTTNKVVPQPVKTASKKTTTVKKEKPTVVPQTTIPQVPVTVPAIETTTTKSKKPKTTTDRAIPVQTQVPTNVDNSSTNSYSLIDDGKVKDNNNHKFNTTVFAGLGVFIIAVSLFIIGTKKYSKRKDRPHILTHKIENTKKTLNTNPSPRPSPLLTSNPSPLLTSKPSPLLSPVTTKERRSSFTPSYIASQNLTPPPNAYGVYDNASYNSEHSYYSNSGANQAYQTNVNTPVINISPVYSTLDYQTQSPVNTTDNYQQIYANYPYANYNNYNYNYNYAYDYNYDATNLSPVSAAAGAVVYATSPTSATSTHTPSISRGTQTSPRIDDKSNKSNNSDETTDTTDNNDKNENNIETTSPKSNASQPNIVVSPPNADATNNDNSLTQDAFVAPKRRESKLVYPPSPTYLYNSSPEIQTVNPILPEIISGSPLAVALVPEIGEITSNMSPSVHESGLTHDELLLNIGIKPRPRPTSLPPFQQQALNVVIPEMDQMNYIQRPLSYQPPINIDQNYASPNIYVAPVIEVSPPPKEASDIEINTDDNIPIVNQDEKPTTIESKDDLSKNEEQKSEEQKTKSEEQKSEEQKTKDEEQKSEEQKTKDEEQKK